MKKTISALLILIGFLSIKAGMPGQYSGIAEKLESAHDDADIIG